MSVLMWHPITNGTFESPDSAVHQWLQSGWLPAAEREEYERRAAEQAKAAEEASTQASGSQGGKNKAASTKEA